MVILIISVELEHVILAVEFTWVVFSVIARAIISIFMMLSSQSTIIRVNQCT